MLPRMRCCHSGKCCSRRFATLRTFFAPGIVMGALFAFSSRAEQPYVIHPTTGKKISGISVTADKDGKIYLKTEAAILPFDKGTQVVMDEPSDYPRAVQMIQQRQYDSAIETLKKIIREHRFLGWDIKAMPLLSAAYLNKENFTDAVATYEQLFSESPGAKDNGDARHGYLKSLLGAKQFDKLEPMLDETIVRGERNVAAAAQMMRGNMKMAKGDFENAVHDFQRTAELFKEESDFLPEANYKVGECLEKIGDPRATNYYNVVISKFPDSPFGAMARRKRQ